MLAARSQLFTFVDNKSKIINVICFACGHDTQTLLRRFPFQNLATQLQQSVMEFTKRLHGVKVERRDLRAEVTSLRSEYHAQAAASSDAIKQQVTRGASVFSHKYRTKRAQSCYSA